VVDLQADRLPQLLVVLFPLLALEMVVVLFVFLHLTVVYLD